MSVARFQGDPSEIMLKNVNLGPEHVLVGGVLLLVWVFLQTIAAPINIVRDAFPISYQVVRTPEEAFEPAVRQGYSFRSHYLKEKRLPRVHYLDEGDREANQTLLLLHGGPFWSHCFIKVIPSFVKAGYRVIAPDFIGFGKSDKFTDYRVYNTSLHNSTLRRLLKHLRLKGQITLVGHNWGWMIGAGLAKDFPRLFTRFVIMNVNNLPDGNELSPTRYSDPWLVVKFALINSFFLAFHASMDLLRSFFPLSLMIHALNRNYSTEEVAGFMAPFTTREERGGTTSFPLMVPITPTHPGAEEMSEIRGFLSRTSIPTLILFSDTSLLPWLSQGDFVVGNAQIFYRVIIPGQKTVYRVYGGGHVIMYDQPEVVSRVIINFINKNKAVNEEDKKSQI